MSADVRKACVYGHRASRGKGAYAVRRIPLRQAGLAPARKQRTFVSYVKVREDGRARAILTAGSG